MGSHLQSDCSRRAIVMKLLLLSLVLVGVQGQAQEEMKRIMDTINLYNLRTNCWGQTNTNNFQVAVQKAQEKCMQLAPSLDIIQQLVPQENPFTTLPAPVSAPFRKLQDFQNIDELQSLWRTKRQATTGLLKPDESDFAEFLSDFSSFKGGIASKMSNLTCVLTEMKYLTSDLKINIEEYTKPVTEIEGFVAEESVAGQDPEYDPAEHGLPKDKYDAAAVSIMVLNNAATPEEEFVGEFFWGMEH